MLSSRHQQQKGHEMNTQGRNRKRDSQQVAKNWTLEISEQIAPGISEVTSYSMSREEMVRLQSIQEVDADQFYVELDLLKNARLSGCRCSTHPA